LRRKAGQPQLYLHRPLWALETHGLLALAIVAVGLAVRGSEDHQREHGREQKV